jgi:hypothetical protein
LAAVVRSCIPRGSWAAFVNGIPLTAAEFETIVRNVAPYLHES